VAVVTALVCVRWRRGGRGPGPYARGVLTFAPVRSLLRIWIALALFGVGFTLLVDRLAPSAHVFAILRHWWPLALVLLGAGGALRLLVATKNVLRGPIVVILTGSVLLLVTLDPLSASVRPLFWPAVLVVAGAGMLVAMAVRASTADGRLVTRLISVAEGRRVVWPKGEFSLGTVTAVASGCVIDLSEARLQELQDEDTDEVLGYEARIDITAVLSGIDLLVPAGWRVLYEEYPAVQRDNELPSVAPTLRVKTFSLLGQVRVRQEQQASGGA